MLQLVSCNVIKIQDIGFKTFGMELRTVVGPSSDSSWQRYYMLGTTTKLSMLFQVLGLWLHLKEIFFLGLSLRLT